MSSNLRLSLPTANVKMGSDAGDDDDQVEKKPEIFEEEEAYDAFVANTRIVVDCLLMLRRGAFSTHFFLHRMPRNQ